MKEEKLKRSIGRAFHAGRISKQQSPMEVAKRKPWKHSKRWVGSVQDGREKRTEFEYRRKKGGKTQQNRDREERQRGASNFFDGGGGGGVGKNGISTLWDLHPEPAGATQGARAASIGYWGPWRTRKKRQDAAQQRNRDVLKALTGGVGSRSRRVIWGNSKFRCEKEKNNGSH